MALSAAHQLAITRPSKGLQLWDLSLGKRLRRLPESQKSNWLKAVISADGQSIAALSTDHHVTIWQTSN